MQPSPTTDQLVLQRLTRQFETLRARADSLTGDHRTAIHAQHQRLIDTLERAINASNEPSAPPRSAA